MGTQPSFSRRVAFGPFELDSSSGQLRKHGIRIRLGGQPLQLLSVLLEQPGEVLSREELRQQLWRDSAFGDFEHGLNAAVNKLRQALGDSAEQPRYVETLPGRGYRFIGPIHRAATETVRQMSPLAAVHTQAPPLLSRKTRAWLPWLAVSLAAGLAGGYWFGIRGRKPELAQALRFTVSPPSGFVLESASSHQTFALSPDGRRLAFTAMNASGLFSAWVREQGAIEPKLIPDSAGAHIVFWAPDSRSLILTVRGKVRREMLEGDAHQVLCDAPPFLLAIAWLQSGRLLLSSRFGASVVSTSGGTPLPVKEPYLWPQVLPDGDHLLYVAFDSRIGRWLARVSRFGEPGSPTTLLEADSRVVYAGSAVKPGTGYLMYVRAGTLLARPFDPRSLRITGEPVSVAGKIYSFHPTGENARISVES